MSKYAIRGGHSLDIRGASGIVDEVNEDRRITSKVIEYLRQLGHEVLDVTPTISGTSLQDLSVPVNKANNWGADYFASIHLNASNSLGHGTEVLYKSAKGKEYADRIVSKLSSLGFSNRGSKQDVRGLYEFNNTVMPNNIIEVYFCDNIDDVAIYNKVGIDVIAKVIAEGITGQSIQVNKPVEQNQVKPQVKEEFEMENIVLYGNQIDKRASEYLADALKCPTFDANIPYDYSKIKNIYCVGGVPSLPWTGYAKEIIAGSNRFETMQLVLNKIKQL